MTPEFFREQQLMRGAVGQGTATVVTPAQVFLSLTFASVTPDIAAGGSTFVAGYEIARSGDTSLPVTVGVALTGRVPTPLVAADVLGGLSDVTYTIPAGQSRLPLSFSFPAQDLLADHFGRVQLHNASVPIVGNGRFDFTLLHNTLAVIQGSYALSPDYTLRAAKHQAGGADSSVVQLAAGLGAQLKGGSVVGDDTNGLALWFTRRTTLDWDMSFTTKKLDATDPTSGALTEELMLLYFGCTGNGGSFPADVSAWPATTNPWSHNYRANLKGAALTLYNQTDANATVAHAVALGVFKGDDTRTNVTGTLGTLFPFVQGTVYTWTIKRRGETVTVSATDGATTWTDSFTAPAGALLSAYADAGNIGLLVSAQRQIEIGDLTVTDGIAGTPAYALVPDWKQKWVQHTTPLGLVTQLALGVELAAGTNITDDNATLVSKDIHTSGAGPVPPGVAPLAGWTAAADLMLASDPLYHPIRNLADMAQLGTMHAGHQYVVVNDINLGGHTYNLDGGNGGAGHEAYLRGDTAGRDPSLYPTLSNGILQAKGQNLIVREVAFDACPIVLGAGCSHLQIESNRFSGIDNNEADGFVQHDGTQSVSNVLIAFNLCRKRTSQISAPLLRAKSDKHVVGRSALTHVQCYRNHYDGIREHLPGYTNIYFLGNNDEDEFKDMDFESRDELATDWGTNDPWGEFKYAGCRIIHPTIEFSANTPAGSGGGAVRLRHGRVSSDDTLAAGVGQGQIIDGVLYVWPTAQAGKTVAMECQDGFFSCINCQGIVTDAAADQPGGQPHPGMTEGPLEIWLYQGIFRWEDYVKEAPKHAGNKWPTAGKCLVGGNHGTVKIGQPRTGTTYYPDYCRVAPPTLGRADRNKAVVLIKEDPTHGTDQATAVPGAAYDTYLHRLAPAEVGCAGWDASYYGSGGGGSGDLDVSFDYTCTATPATTDANGCASLFYCHMVGQGAYPADMSAWDATQWGAAGDTEYQPNANWFRFTFNTLNTVTPAISNKARLVVVIGGVLTRPNPNEPQADFFFPVGTKYRLRCRKSGNDFRFDQTDAAGNVKTQTWTDATAGAMNTGNFLWRFQPARHGKIENLTVA